VEVFRNIVLIWTILFSKKHIFSKVDEIVAEVSKRKPLADLDPSCLPKPKPVEPPHSDDGDKASSDEKPQP
jgi:hypothetical protein